MDGTGNVNLTSKIQYLNTKCSSLQPLHAVHNKKGALDVVGPDARPSLMRAALLLLSFPSKGGMCIKFGMKPN